LGEKMQSKISEAIFLKHDPVAILWSDEKPENAFGFKPLKWGCIMWLVVKAASGKITTCSRNTFGCFGGGVGVGFGNQYKSFPAGEEGFYRFLSYGNIDWEPGRQITEQVRPFLRKEIYDCMLYGEQYMKSPDLVKKFVDTLPMVDIPYKYVVFKPLSKVNIEDEEPQVIVFFVDPDQLSALVVLANYGREDNDNVIIPNAAGCQTIGIYPYKEAASDRQRAVVGLTDLSARSYSRAQLGDKYMTFTVPLKMYEEMESNVEKSFLQRHAWNHISKSKKHNK
jgi:COG2043 family uncharacterized protein